MPVDAIERSKQIGAALKSARLRAGRSIRQCARHLGVSIRRYSGIESGKSYIAAVELEELVDYLNIPPHEVWPQAVIDHSRQRVVVDAQPGQSVEILVNIGKETESEI